MVITSATRVYNEQNQLTGYDVVRDGISSTVPDTPENADYDMLMIAVNANEVTIGG